MKQLLAIGLCFTTVVFGIDLVLEQVTHINETLATISTQILERETKVTFLTLANYPAVGEYHWHYDGNELTGDYFEESLPLIAKMCKPGDGTTTVSDAPDNLGMVMVTTCKQ